MKKVKVNPEANRQGFWGAGGYGYGYGGGYGYMPDGNDLYDGSFDYKPVPYHDDHHDIVPVADPYMHGYGPVYMGGTKPRGNGQGPRPFQRHQPY